MSKWDSVSFAPLVCRKCAKIYRPLFVVCELEKIDYGITSYSSFRGTLKTVLEHDIPHPECRHALIEFYDNKYGW